MKHIISLSTTDILLINKALRLDMQNVVDNELAKRLIDKLNDTVAKDLEEGAEWIV